MPSMNSVKLITELRLLNVFIFKLYKPGGPLGPTGPTCACIYEKGSGEGPF